MTETLPRAAASTPPLDAVPDGDPTVPWRAGPLLGAFARAGVLTAADVRTAERLGRLTGEPDETVHLAAALAVRALRAGSVCFDLRTAPDLVAEDIAGEDVAVETEAAAPSDRPSVAALPWPEPAAWHRALAASPAVSLGAEGPTDRPVRLVDGLVYLDRYWRDEQAVRSAVTARLASALPVDEPSLADALARCFPPTADGAQVDAAATAARSRLTVLTGGPGTGKTTTVARLVATLQQLAATSRPPVEPGASDPAVPLRVAFCAPTGKAASRLQESVDTQLQELGDNLPLGPVHATTIHALLRTVPGSTTRFRHDRANRLPHDVVVVDEASMVSLPLLARVLDALRPDARLVLVGDRHQLASVEVGAVLGDLVAWLGPRAGCVVELTVRHRFGEELGALADAINAGDGPAALALLRAGGEHVELLESDDDLVDVDALGPVRADVERAGAATVSAARAGDAEGALRALGAHRLLVAHRRGPAGVARWAALAEGWVAEATGPHDRSAWPVGRPLLVTTNDRTTRLSNGDTGVVVAQGDGVTVAFGDPQSVHLVPPHRLPVTDPVYAMTVHRAQGSQFDHVTVVLPPATSPLLTRELLYTAVTRAKDLVRVVGTAEAVLAAVARPVRRASGLAGSRRPGGA
ncbi:exodeoxyribonuclease V subunit alpha [Luteimicrobium subarcticum]|uniref:RecBCD enzyme subunit RecD n=1 Tax=Luteimicrobium subarcticum TaxID=620910 RepID=A0A2M8WW38_9MICO|nr:exodeoxyribonuclease V subunit alpha [Luteimicrobium subarcticum]PJI95145.1 DNA helicase/exodeoxyribonuclease V alpha subunit [Luteimicrobium subarcticum]